MQLVVPRKRCIELPPVQMLRFTNDIPAEIFTNRNIVLQIELVNIESGSLCTGEPASPLEVEIFVTRGNFPSNDRKPRKCKPLCPRSKATMPLLVQAAGTKAARKGVSFKSNLVVKLHNGRAVVKVKITDNSSWVKSKSFKFVARVMKGSYQGRRRIKEALSKAFRVKESKLEGRRKADVPSPTDPTWRLINVGKMSEKILQDIGINTVLDFLNKLEADPEGLKGTVGMQNMKWEATVEHARQCRVSLEEVNGSNSRGNGTGEAVEEMPEQPSTGQGMTMDNDIYCNQVYDISIDDYISPDINPGLEPCTLPNPMPEFQLRNMGMGEQVASESNLASGQMERFPSNTSFNGNNEPNWILEGMVEHPTVHHNYTRLYSNQWKHDFSDFSAFSYGESSHQFL